MDDEIKPHALTKRLTDARVSMREQARILKRARRLYVSICRETILYDDNGWSLEKCARRMHECGMYAEGRSIRDCRFSILRYLWKLDQRDGSRLNWHEWRREMGYANSEFRRDVA